MIGRLLRMLRPAPGPDAPAGFGYKNAWFAVRDADPRAVAEALRLRGVRPSTWRAGVADAYAANVFVTPPVHGWVLAMGTKLGPRGAAPDEEPCLATLRDLSSRFGEACYFATHRVVELCAWARAEHGVVLRAYGFVGDRGETFWDQGAATPGEPVDGEAGSGEESVMRMAGSWSIDPTAIESLGLPPSLGLTGRP